MLISAPPRWLVRGEGVSGGGCAESGEPTLGEPTLAEPTQGVWLGLVSRASYLHQGGFLGLGCATYASAHLPAAGVSFSAASVALSGLRCASAVPLA